MLRRNMSLMRVVLFIGLIGIAVVGIYHYQSLIQEVHHAEEREESIRNQLDSASNQLEELIQDKRNMENTLDTERRDHRRAMDDLKKQMEESSSKFMKDKTEIIQRLAAVNAENGRLQGRVDDLQTEVSQLSEKNEKINEEKKSVENQHKAEYMALKEERDNEVQSLKDELHAVQQRVTELDTKLKEAGAKNTELEALLSTAQQRYNQLQAEKQLADAQLKKQQHKARPATEAQPPQHDQELHEAIAGNRTVEEQHDTNIKEKRNAPPAPDNA